MQKIRNIIFITFIIFITIIFFRNTESVDAQATTFLRVAPSRQEIAVDPGQKTTVVVKFVNADPQSIMGFLKVADFIVDNNQGIPNFIEGPTKFSARYAASSWVTLTNDRLMIPAKDQVSVTASLRVPNDAQPGGRYFAIYFEPASEVSGNKGGLLNLQEQAIAPRIAALVYLRVKGPVTESATVKRFVADKFSEYGPLNITTEISNEGNYHIRPVGNITVTNMFGKIVEQQKLEELNIFPDSTREFNNAIGKKWMFGKYFVSFEAAYGETGKALNASFYAWVFPWKVTLAIILAIVILLILIFVIFRNLRQHETELEEKIEELEEKIEEKEENSK